MGILAKAKQQDLVFRYGAFLTCLNYLVCPAASVVSAAFAVYALSFPMRYHYWFAALLGISVAIALATLALLSALLHRPILVDEEAISSLSFGRKKVTITWPKITRIERRRYLDSQSFTPRYKFSIFSAGERIYFDDQISRLDELISWLNHQAKVYGIPLIAVDAGLDTRRKIKATVTDRSVRSQLLRDGVRETLLTL